MGVITSCNKEDNNSNSSLGKHTSDNNDDIGMDLNSVNGSGNAAMDASLVDGDHKDKKIKTRQQFWRPPAGDEPDVASKIHQDLTESKRPGNGKVKSFSAGCSRATEKFAQDKVGHIHTASAMAQFHHVEAAQVTKHCGI